MSKIDSLDIFLRANTSGFDDGLNKADQSLSRFKDRVNKNEGKGGSQLLGSLGGAFSQITSSIPGIGALSGSLGAMSVSLAGVAAGAVAAGAALAAMGVSQMSSIGQAAKMSDMFGVSTEKLQALQVATGMNADELSGKLAHFAQQPMAQAVGLEKALDLVADKVQGASSQTAKLKITMDAFGRGSVDMVNALKNGSKGFDDLENKSKSFGTSFSREQAETVRQANLAWKQMGAAFTGIGTQMAFIVAPFVEKLAKVFTSLFAAISTGIRAAQPYWDVFVEVVSTGFQAIYEVGTVLWAPIQAGLNTIVESLGGFGVSWKDVQNVVLKAFFTLEWGFRHWTDVAVLAFDKIVLSATSFSEDFKHLFLEVVPEIFKQAKSMMLDPFGDWSKQLDAIEAKMRRPFTDYEKKLKVDIQERSKNLETSLAEYVKRKMDEFFAPKAGDKKDNKAQDFMTDKHPSAVEAGSVEAFKIIAGAQGDKMFGVANKQLEEIKGLRQAIEKWAGRQGREVKIALAKV